MIISHKHKFIFIHINKCGGSSVTRALMPYLGPDDLVLGGVKEAEKLSSEYLEKHGIYKHSSAAEIKAFIGEDTFNSYYKFAFVRNPWEKIVSTYFWFHKTGWGKGGKGDRVRERSFNEYVTSPFMDELSCSSFLFENDTLLVDDFYDISQLQSGLNAVCKKVGLPEIPLSKENASSHTHYSSYYTPQSKAYIAEKYSDDIETFGFTFEEEGVAQFYNQELLSGIFNELVEQPKHFNKGMLRLIEASYKLGDASFLEKALSLPELGEKFHTLTPIICSVIAQLNNSNRDICALDKITKASVISLKTSTRREDFIETWHSNVPVQYFEAIDARIADFNPSDFAEYRGHLSENATKSDYGHLGCTLSHFAMWRALLQECEDDNQIYLVLEDDAFPMVNADAVLSKIIDDMPENTDLVYVNNRASEKLFSQFGTELPYAVTDIPTLVSREDVNACMNDNYNLLRKYKESTVHWFGTDGYLITGRGLKKAVAFIDEYGMPPLSEVGSQTNIDMLLSILTTKASDLKGKNIGFNIQQAYQQGVVSETAVFNGFVSSLPVVDVKDRFGIGSGSEIMDQKGGLNQVILGKEEVDKLRDAALILEQTNLRLALKFMELALSMRPNGPVLKKKVKEYRTALNLDISDD